MALMLSNVHDESANSESLLLNMGLGTFHFSTRVVGIFNTGLHYANDDVCPYVVVTACKSYLACIVHS